MAGHFWNKKGFAKTFAAAALGGTLVTGAGYYAARNMAPVLMQDAASKGNTSMVALWAGFDVSQDSKDRSLAMAVKDGHTGTAERLLQEGANLHIQNDSLLYLAASKGHEDTVRMLLDKGASARTDAGAQGLVRAADRGDTGIVRLLIDHDADVQHNHNMALYRSIMSRHPDIEKLLREHGAKDELRIPAGVRPAAPKR